MKKSAILLIFGVLYLPSLAQLEVIPRATEERSKQLIADPGQDYYIRIGKLFSTANLTEERNIKRRYYARCVSLAVDYIKDHPNHRNTPAVMYYLGESYYQTGYVRKAEIVFADILRKQKTGPYAAAAAYRLARWAFAESKFEQAAGYFAITASNAKDKRDQIKSTYFQAQALIQAGKEPEAAVVYRKVALEMGNSLYRESAALTYGKLLLRTKDYAKAKSAFESLLVPNQTEEVKAEAAYHAGVACIGLAQNQEAMDYYKMAFHCNTLKWKGEAQTGIMALFYAEKKYSEIIKLARANKFELTPALQAKQGVMVGHSYYQAKEYVAAINYFIDVETAASGSDSAYKAGYYRLLCYYLTDRGKLPQHVDRFVQVYAPGRGRDKYIHQAFLMKAEQLYADQKYEEAAETYVQVNEKYLEAKYIPSWSFKKAYCWQKIGNHAGAINGFTAYLDSYPNDARAADAMTLRGMSYLKLEDKEKALKDFEAVLKKDPSSQNASLALQSCARIYWGLKKYDAVIETNEKLLAQFPDLKARAKGNAHYWAGNACFKSKKYDKAEAHFLAADKLDPGVYAKQITMMRIYMNFSLKDPEKVEKAVIRAQDIGIRKKIPLDVYRWLGSYYYDRDENMKAATYLVYGLERGKPDQTPVPVWRVLCKAQMKAGLHKEAFTTVSNLMSLELDDPIMVDAMLDKAKIQVALGKNGDAKRTAEQALEMNPVGKLNAELLNILADFYYITAQHAEAAKRYVLLVDDAADLPFHTLVLDRLAVCLAKMDDKPESERYERMLKKKYPTYKREKL